jgi:hypothetical protein
MSTLFHTIIPGPKMYWQFGELGYDYSINWPSGTGDDRLTPKPPKWDYYNNWQRRYVHDVTASLNKLKATQNAWETTDFQIDVYGAVKRVTLLHNEMNVVAIGNFDVVNKEVSIPFPNGGVWYNYFDQQSIDLGANTSWSTTLEPGEFFLFTTVQLENPDLGAGVGEVASQDGLMVYPNPVNDYLQIVVPTGAKGRIEIKVYDVNGRVVYSQQQYSFLNGLETRIPTRDFTGGLYVIQISTESRMHSQKFLKL